MKSNINVYDSSDTEDIDSDDEKIVKSNDIKQHENQDDEMNNEIAESTNMNVDKKKKKKHSIGGAGNLLTITDT